MIIRELDKEERVGGSYNRGLKQYLCECSCGEHFTATSRAMKTRKNCVCSKCVTQNRIELVERVHTTHGMTGTRFYRCRSGMKARCNCPSTDYYEDYGGRGISYQESWEKFENFHKDMFGTYDDTLELERIDVNKGYSLENCEWATESMQGYNQRKRSTNTSGRTGVYATVDGNWWAEIQENGKTKYLGRFYSYESACKARSSAEEEIYGVTKD